MKPALITFVFFLFVLIPHLASAQLSMPGSGVAIEVSPLYPKPGDTVTISLNAYTIDTNGATITWVLNGNTTTSLQNRRSFTFVAGNTGEKTEIQGVIKLQNGQIVSASQSVVVSDVDLIIDAYTLVPSFYQGRPLPSNGSTIKVTAIPHTSENLSPQNYNYTWRLNNKVIEGGSIVGGYVGYFTIPSSGKRATLQVDVSNVDGITVAQKSVVIPSFTPQLLFYLDNPLRGLSRLALPTNYTLQASEATFRAEPYFMDQSILSKNPFLEWSVDGKTIENPSNDQQTITLQNAGGGSGSFSIQFHLRNLQQLLQGVRGGFNISF